VDPIRNLIVMPMKSRIAGYLLIIALIGVVIIDLSAYLLPANHSMVWIVIETVVDFGAIVLLFLVLSREIRARRGAEELLAEKNMELRAAFEELAQASALKSNLIGIVSHDLKNPLQAVMGYSQLLLLESATDENSQEMLGSILARSQDMLSIISDLLDTEAVESGSLALVKERVSLTKIVGQIVESFEVEARKKGQNLVFVGCDTDFVEINILRFSQIANNLLSNAIKYSPLNAPIFVSVKSQTGWVRLEVKDAGPGFTEDEKARLFQKFPRLNKKTTANESSTGLGLSVVKLMTELHGGKVFAESPGIGYGSTFGVEFPK